MKGLVRSGNNISCMVEAKDKVELNSLFIVILKLLLAVIHLCLVNKGAKLKEGDGSSAILTEAKERKR